MDRVARGLNVRPSQLLTGILHASADVGNDGPARRRAQRHGHLRRDAPRREPRPTSSAPKQQKSVARSGSARSLRSTAGRLRSISTPSWPRSQQSSRPSWRRKSTPQRVPERVPRNNRRSPFGFRRLGLLGIFKTSNERGMGLEPTTSSLGRRRKTRAEWSTRQFPSEGAMLGVLTAGYFAVSSSANGSRNGSRELSS